MPTNQNPGDRVARILFIVGWVLGAYGILLLADDIWQNPAQNNLYGVVFILVGIALLVYSRNRRSDGGESADDDSQPGGPSPVSEEEPSRETNDNP